MIKRLLLPGFAVGALALVATPSGAGSFFIDNFDRPLPVSDELVSDFCFEGEQCLTVDRSFENASSTVSGLDVLGGSRQLTLDLLKTPSRFATATSKVNAPDSTLDINNEYAVSSTTTLRYNNNGLGLGSAGKWITGNNRPDYFTMKILSLDNGLDDNSINTVMDIIFRIGDGNQTSEIKRTATLLPDGSFMINNLANLPPFIQSPNSAIFELSEFLSKNPNINLDNVQYVEFIMNDPNSQNPTPPGINAKIDFIQGVEIPEPSLVIGSLIAVGLGSFVSKNK